MFSDMVYSSTQEAKESPQTTTPEIFKSKDLPIEAPQKHKQNDTPN